MSRKRAFTLIELLVVISVIALLLAILVPALRKAKDMAGRVTCGNNIKQNVLSLLIYAMENEEKLPLQKMGGWLHDVSYETTDMMIKRSGGDKDTFYCPSTKWNADNPLLWQWWQSYQAGVPFNGPEPTTNRDQYYRVTGYFWMMEFDEGRGWQPLGKHNFLLKTTMYSSDDGDGNTGGPVKNSSATPLCTDQLFTDDYGDDYLELDFTGSMYGGLGEVFDQYDLSNHVNSGKPTGTNIGYVDGHVGWRNVDKIRRRNNWAPYHWW